MEKKDKELFAMRDGWYEEASKQTPETLPAFLSKLAEHKHDYNTICYAVAASALGAAHAMNRSPNGGITGFQAGAVMWEFIQRWMHMDGPMRLVEYDNLLYPQYAYKFTSITQDTFDAIRKKAIANLEENDGAHHGIVAHWMSIRDGVVPFGLQIHE